MTAARRLNILLIHADQHRFDCLGAYGNPDVRTPNIDRLAADGVRFENSFCPYPVCTPSRYSLLSGLYVHDHGGWSNRCTLAPDIPTFPKLLREAGCRTAAVGKMHFTPTYLDVGFDELVLVEQDGDGRWDDDFHRELRDRGMIDALDVIDQRREYREHAADEYWASFGALASDLPDEAHSTTWTADRAMEAIEQWGDGSNLLMVGFIKPHHPFDPPVPWDQMYDPEDVSILPGWTEASLPHDLSRSRGYFPNETLTEKTLRRVMAHYYATISHIDHHVGRMLKLLDDKGLYEDTLIVYTSDHGDFMGFHHMILKGNNMYDPLAKVPLIIKFPGRRRAGEVHTGLVNNVDLAPTILAQAGLRPDARMTGRDLSADTQGAPRVFAESAIGGPNAQLMVRSQTHKLLWSPQRPDRCLFFDLAADPLEMTNRFGDPRCQETVEQMQAAAEAWMGPSFPGTFCCDESAPVIQRPNVPVPDDGHRESVAEHCRREARKSVLWKQ